MAKKIELPGPNCEIGYSEDLLEEVLGERYPEFKKWMVGQTGGICDGSRFDAENNRMVASGCGPHGFTSYSWDVQRFLDGRPVVD
jgi:hypothetical protein